jgi:glycosyltransferase involved in cell wall biosynthesis
MLRREGVRPVGRKLALRVSDRFVAPWQTWIRSRKPWTPDDRPVFLMVLHRGGGGTERHVRDLAVGLQALCVRTILVRPGQQAQLLWEERDTAWRVTWCRLASTERASIREMLSLLAPVHAHCHHLMGMPGLLIDLLRDCGIPYDWTFHDYYAICPRGHLGHGGLTYCGEPNEGVCNSCLARWGDYDGRSVAEPINEWRVRFDRHVSGARRVFVPSEDVRRRLTKYFSHLDLAVRPHPEAPFTLKPLAAAFLPGETLRVAVIGTITALKGSLLLLACCRHARDQGLPLEFVIFGNTDSDAALRRQGNVRLTGAYREGEIIKRLASERCHLAFLPTPLPESYMYTLSIAIAAGLYTVVFDIGAQAERVKAWGWGRTLPLDASPGAITEILFSSASLVAGRTAPPPPSFPTYPDLLIDYYGFSTEDLHGLGLSTRPSTHTALPIPQLVRRRDHARIH